MPDITLLHIIELLGIIMFAISGGLSAFEKRMDIFGILVIATVTALGGGMVRDVIVGDTPVLWLKDVNYVYYVLIGYLITLIFRKKLSYFRKSLFLFDTIGLGMYTIVGIEKGIKFGLDPINCIALGTITACFGGVMRDILCNQIPILFKKEIYALICIAGGIFYFFLNYLGVNATLNFFITAGLIILTRIIVVRFNISLPKFYKEQEHD